MDRSRTPPKRVGMEFRLDVGNKRRWHRIMRHHRMDVLRGIDIMSRIMHSYGEAATYCLLIPGCSDEWGLVIKLYGGLIQWNLLVGIVLCR